MAVMTGVPEGGLERGRDMGNYGPDGRLKSRASTKECASFGLPPGSALAHRLHGLQSIDPHFWQPQ